MSCAHNAAYYIELKCIFWYSPRNRILGENIMANYYNQQGGGEHSILRAVDEIQRVWGDYVDIKTASDSKLKFGASEEVGTTPTTLQWEGGNETYVTTNSIDTASSSDAGDTDTVIVQGYILTAGLLSYVEQEVTLDGQNKVVLGTALARVDRIYNSGTTDWLGDIYVYEDDTITLGVPDTATKVHMKAPAQFNQSMKGAGSTANDEYLLVTAWHAAVFRKKDGVIDFGFYTREVGTTNKVFRLRMGTSASEASGGSILYLDPVFIIPRNHDYRFQGIAAAIDTAGYGAINGVIAKVVS